MVCCPEAAAVPPGEEPSLCSALGRLKPQNKAGLSTDRLNSSFFFFWGGDQRGVASWWRSVLGLRRLRRGGPGSTLHPAVGFGARSQSWRRPQVSAQQQSPAPSEPTLAHWLPIFPVVYGQPPFPHRTPSPRLQPLQEPRSGPCFSRCVPCRAHQLLPHGHLLQSCKASPSSSPKKHST